jgi:hypothetical protein
VKHRGTGSLTHLGAAVAIALAGATIALVLLLGGGEEVKDRCVADDARSVRECLAGHTPGSLLIVEVGRRIDCNAPAACAFRLAGANRVSIVGRAGAAFVRKDARGHPIFDISASRHVRVSGLLFDENEDVSCAPVAEPRLCRPTIAVTDSSDVILDKLTIRHSKESAIRVEHSRGVVISRSRIVAPLLFGIAFRGRESRIEENLIRDARSNGLVLTDSSNVVVSDNQLVHNHRANVFRACGPSGAEPCDGGQLYVGPNTHDVRIVSNTIRDGSSDVYPETRATGGIEIAAAEVSGVVITRNVIRNNTMWGIYVNPDPRGVQGVVIERNRLCGNGRLPPYRSVQIGNLPSEPAVVRQFGNTRAVNCRVP